jgi:molecular chaperone GrpE
MTQQDEDIKEQESTDQQEEKSIENNFDEVQGITPNEENTSSSNVLEDDGFKDRFFRLQADYDNFKKRTERDRIDMLFYQR